MKRYSIANFSFIILLLFSTGFLSFIFQRIFGQDTGSNIYYYFVWGLSYLLVVIVFFCVEDSIADPLFLEEV